MTGYGNPHHRYTDNVKGIKGLGYWIISQPVNEVEDPSRMKNPLEIEGGCKTSHDMDTTCGRFVTLVPGERIVQAVEFESDRPGSVGEMRITLP